MMAKTKTDPPTLNGWLEISKYLGQPLSVVERWAKSGMPVERKGRHVTASSADLNAWLGRESAGEPIHIASETEDLSADLKRGLKYVREKTREQA